MDAPSSSSSLPISSNLVVSTTPPTSTFSHPRVADKCPLPFLPIELKREILRFCDPSTLAQTSLVSLAFLEMSSPLLYHDVTVRGWENVVKLFCVEKPQLQRPETEDYLSLEQIQHLTYIHLPYTPSGPPPSRRSPIPVSSLAIEFVENDGHGNAPSSYLLSLVDPVIFTVQGPLPKCPHDLPYTLLDHADRWTRLQSVSLRNARLFIGAGCRWFPALESSFVTVVIDVSDTVVGQDSEETETLLLQLRQFMAQAHYWELDRKSPTWLGLVRVLMGSTEEAVQFRRRYDATELFWDAWYYVDELVYEICERIEVLSVSSSSTQSST